jgi:LacI family transcriptional regulator
MSGYLTENGFGDAVSGSKVTIDEVARRANVSKATVSRVLNGVEGQASEATIERVKAVIEETGYIPNRLAANLKTSRSMTIGVVVADIVNPFFAEIARGVEEVVQDDGFSVILANTSNDRDREVAQVRALLGQRVDGLIVATSFHDSAFHLEAAVARGVRTVLINNELPDLDIDRVLVENEAGARRAVAALIEAGALKIAHIAGPLQTSSGVERLKGYQRALTAASLEVDPSLVLQGDFSQDSGFDLMNELLDRDDHPDAVFVANNLMAFGALDALNSRSVSIPDEMAFVAFDDAHWFHMVQPSISAVAQPTTLIGSSAAELLLRRMEEDRPTDVRVLESELRVRDSIGRANA